MRFKLKVIGGKNDGREIEIKGEFLIGRGEGVNLRPRSDLISRHHCKLFVEDGKAFVTDLDSRNGTYVNGDRIKGKVQLDLRDSLRVGRLQFEVVLDHAQPGAKKPKVVGVKEAANRQVSKESGGDSSSMDESITDWLAEAADSDSGQQTMMETRQFRMDETEQVVPGVDDSVIAKRKAEEDDEDDESQEDSKIAKKKKQKPGKLPPIPKASAGDSKEAAQDMLRKFFNRR